MRNLLLFIAKYHAFLLFLLLELLCFSLIYRYNHFQRARFVNSSNAFVGNMLSKVHDFKSYLGLRRVNDALIIENAFLKDSLENVKNALLLELNGTPDFDMPLAPEIIPFLPPPSASKSPSNDSLPSINPIYEFIGATVINNSTKAPRNYITINKGGKHGIAPEMGVVGPNGVVGIVKEVSENFSSIISLLHTNLPINAKIAESGANGSLHWDGIDPAYARLNEVGRSQRVRKGERVVTNNYSSIFPPDIPIGIIVNEPKFSEGDFHNLRVNLATDFTQLQYVYVVKYLLRNERQNLEQKVKNE